MHSILQNSKTMNIYKLSNATPNIESENLPRLLGLHNSNPPKICFPTLDGFLFIKVSEISHFKSDEIYARIYTVSGKIHFITKSLKWLEQKCESFNFYRVHKCYFINPYNIHKHVKKNGGYLIMENQEIIPISRTKKESIKRLLGVH